MADVATFGKKKPVRAARPSPKPGPSSSPAPQPETTPDDDLPLEVPTLSPWRSVPFVTLGLVAILALAYSTENIPAVNLSLDVAANAHELLLEGGLSRLAVLRDSGWWRLFTAPLLHDGVLMLTANLITLLYAGWIFERLIGRAWFAALFVMSALCGCLGALALDPPTVVAVGSTGGLMGVLAAAFVCSFIFASEQLRKRMQRFSARLLVPSLLPAVLPLWNVGLGQADYGMPVGGAIAGAVIGFLLRALWPDDAIRPHGVPIAFIIAAAGALLSAYGFAVLRIAQ